MWRGRGTTGTRGLLWRREAGPSCFFWPRGWEGLGCLRASRGSSCGRVWPVFPSSAGTLVAASLALPSGQRESCPGKAWLRREVSPRDGWRTVPDQLCLVSLVEE